MNGIKAALDQNLIINQAGSLYDYSYIYNKIRFLEPLITNDVRDSLSGNSLAGEEWSVKTASSVNDKLARLLKTYSTHSRDSMLLALPITLVVRGMYYLPAYIYIFS